MASEAFVAPKRIFRLLQDWPYDGGPKAGTLVAQHSHRPELIWSRVDGRGGQQFKFAELDLEPRPALTWRDFPALLDFYLNGGAMLPNLKLMDTGEALNRIAAGGGLKAYPGVANVHTREIGSNWGTCARAFLSTEQGGTVNGTGYVIAYNGRHGAAYGGAGLIYSFALCDHKTIIGAGARPMYGWHPSRCSRCGLDTSVDSSD